MKIEQLNNIKCVNGDCMDWMKQIPDKFYDLAIVDKINIISLFLC